MLEFLPVAAAAGVVSSRFHAFHSVSIIAGYFDRIGSNANNIQAMIIAIQT